MKKIIHATTVHPRSDTRIRLKEIQSLSERLNADVRLYVMDGLADEVYDGYIVHSVGPKLPRQRNRLKVGIWRMYRALLEAKPDIVHFHDPELIPIGLLLKLHGISVISDIHENVPKQLMGRPGVMFQKILPPIVNCFETLGDWIFDGLVCATPEIKEKFSPKKAVLVQNFPLEGELAAVERKDYKGRPPDFAFIGGISKIRGTIQMIDALSLTAAPKACLQMAGSFAPESHRIEAESRKGWSNVTFHGWADRPTVASILSDVRAGLVLYLPLPNHINAQPNKLFEYMSAGVPVIASHFSLWRQIVDGAGCGLLVDPENPRSIAKAMDWILANPQEAEAMGLRGKLAVETTYNWAAEAEKLIAFYHEHLGVQLKTEKQKATL